MSDTPSYSMVWRVMLVMAKNVVLNVGAKLDVDAMVVDVDVVLTEVDLMMLLT